LLLRRSTGESKEEGLVHEICLGSLPLGADGKGKMYWLGTCTNSAFTQHLLDPEYNNRNAW
jgi:hypothetical protein